MADKKIDLEKFQAYKEKAILDCKSLSYIEKGEGLWSEPEIVDYFSKIPSEEPLEKLALSLKDLLPSLDNKKILCIGGGTGKLGRLIATLYPTVQVTEIDSSREMVTCANQLASDKSLAGRFISIEADAKSLPFNDNEFDYAFAYGIFRYLDLSDQKKVLSEIGRVTGHNFTIAESLAKEIIYRLQEELEGRHAAIKETNVSMFRVSLFYMLFKEYKRNNIFKALVDSELDQDSDFIRILTSIAGMAEGVLYELRVGNRIYDGS